MAVAAPVVVFGFLYVLRVQPERAAVAESRNELAEARGELNRRRAFVTHPPVVTEVPALDSFEARTMEANRVGDVADALTALLKSPAVGGVSNLSVETGLPTEPPMDSTARLFSPTVVQTPVTVMFDAQYEQIGRFFWNLRVLPTTFDLTSVELTPGIASRAGLMRAKVSLSVFHRPETTAQPAPAPRTQIVDVVTAPEWTRDPFAKRSRPVADRPATPSQPAPVVSSILFSRGRRIAMVDGRIVRPGDRVRSGVVRSIEPDAVVIAEANGVERRVAIERPVIRMANP
jgi:hypothetical protein